MDGLTLGNVISSIVATAIVWLFTVAVRFLGRHFEKAHPNASYFARVAAYFIYPLSAIVVFLFIPKTFILFFLLTSILFVYWNWRILSSFRRTGIVSADSSIAKGLGVSGSLKLCSNSLEFLGVGAGKLTNQGSLFEEAIARCDRADRPIRFLLCEPTSAELIAIARRAGKPDGVYQAAVNDSIRQLARLRMERERNLEVRLYQQMPLFRLMFIDDRLCLVSHYVFGEGDGSQLPQLHILKASSGQTREVESLYFAFHNYFEEIWRGARPWNPSEYI